MALHEEETDVRLLAWRGLGEGILGWSRVKIRSVSEEIEAKRVG